jgi:hypothetical protein
MGTAAGVLSPDLQGVAAGDDMQPACQRGRLSNGLGPAGQGKEGGLESVLRILFIA